MSQNPPYFNAIGHGFQPVAEKCTASQRCERANSDSCVASTLFFSASGFNPWLLLLSLAFCLLPCAVRADPIIGPPVEQNGLRFESWLASPVIAIPNKNQGYKNSVATTLFSIRVTNLTQTPMRFNPFVIFLKLIMPSGNEALGAVVVAGGVLEYQESDFLVIQPGQSLVLSEPSHLYWVDNSLCLDWPSFSVKDHPWEYGNLPPGTYHFSLHCTMLSPALAIRDNHTLKIIKTLNGFWTGDVTLPPVKFELEPTPAR